MAKTKTPLPDALLAFQGEQVPVSEDKLVKLRSTAQELFNLDSEIAQLEAEVESRKKRLIELSTKTLPDLLDSAGTDKVGLPEVGVDAVLKPYYRANIAAEWEEERRLKAFDWLAANGHGDMVKVTVTVAFGRQEYDKAQNYAERVRKAGFTPKLDMGVPWTTLTAFVKEQFEANDPPPLDLLGATVGRVVKLIERK